MAVAGILEKDVGIAIALVRPSHRHEDVLVAIVVDVAKCDPVALLQMAKATAGGDILESSALGISEHPVRDQGGQVWLTGSKVGVEHDGQEFNGTIVEFDDDEDEVLVRRDDDDEEVWVPFDSLFLE